jgi:hypothetical protein
VIGAGLFFGQTVAVETYLGAGDTGDTYAASVDVTGMLDDGLMLSTSGPTGDVVESVTVFYCDISHAATFVPESRVTTATGVMQVSTVKRRQASSTFAAVEHLEVRLK